MRVGCRLESPAGPNPDGQAGVVYPVNVLLIRRLRRQAPRWALVLTAALLLGADCPHCDAGEVAHEAATEAMPCHDMEGETAPAGGSHEAAPVLDCGCSSCELELAVSSVRVSAEDVSAAAAVVPALQPLAAAPPQLLARCAGHPPPYPGFSEHTVVSLN